MDKESDMASAPPKKSRVEVQSLPARQYLDQTVVPILLQALSSLAKERPPDPINYLATYLMRNKGQYDTGGSPSTTQWLCIHNIGIILILWTNVCLCGLSTCTQGFHLIRSVIWDNNKLNLKRFLLGLFEWESQYTYIWIYINCSNLSSVMNSLRYLISLIEFEFEFIKRRLGTRGPR